MMQTSYYIKFFKLVLFKQFPAKSEFYNFCKYVDGGETQLIRASDRKVAGSMPVLGITSLCLLGKEI